MSRRSGVNTLSDALLKARSAGAKPPRVSLILNGVKYKPGQAPARVCPPGKRLVRRALAAKV